MRKVLIGLGVLIILLAIGVLAVAAFFDVNRYRPQIEGKLQERLQRNVSLGQIHPSFFPFAFRVDNVVIDEDPPFAAGRPFAKIRTLFVRPELLPLLHNEIRIDSLQLQEPQIEFLRSEQGIWNYSTLGHRGQQPSEFSLDHLKIYDGQVAVTDLQQRKPRTIYDHIDFVLSGFSPDKSFSVDARAHVPGADGRAIVLSGTAGPIHDGLTGTPFDGKLKLEGVSLSGLQQFSNVQTVADYEAVLTGAADIRNKDGVLISKGKFEARDVRIHDSQISYPIAVDYDVSSDLKASTVQIQTGNLKLGPTPVSIEGVINAQPSPAVVDLKVQADNESIGEAARLAAAFGVAFNPHNEINGTLSFNVHAKGPVDKAVLDGHVSGRNIRISGGELRQPVQTDAIELTLTPDAIRSNEFTAKTGGAAVTAQFTASQYTSDSPRIDAKVNTGGSDLGELLKIARAYGVSAANGVNGSGSVSLDVTASGPLKESDRMTYSGSGALHNASIDSPSFSQPVQIRNADLRFTSNSVVLDRLDCSVGQTTARGTMTLRNLAAPQVDFALSANTINVADWQEKTADREVATPHRTSVKADNILTRTTGSGRLSIDEVVYDKISLKNVISTVTLDHGLVTMKPISAGLFGGQQAGTIVMDTRSRPITYSVDSRLQSVDANELLSSITPAKQTLYGLLSANADVHFVTTTARASDIVHSLSGRVSLNLKNGKIANLDLLHQLGTIGQFLNTSRAVEPFTQVIQLNGDFDIHNGVARTNNLKATLDAGSLAANGIIDLAQQNVDLRVTAVLAQDYSRTVGGPDIGGFLNTALANQRGELVLPVLITGTLQNPHVAPDLQKVAELKLQNLLPTANNPAQLTIGILGNVLRGKAITPDAAPLGGFEDILRGVLGGGRERR